MLTNWVFITDDTIKEIVKLGLPETIGGKKGESGVNVADVFKYLLEFYKDN